MGTPATPSSGGVFISYRRQETAPYARMLREEVGRRLGAAQVFMDVDSIEIGVDFAEAIQRAVDSCEVLLALIGPQWLTITDAEGQRRLDNHDDTVRLEIEAALARNVRVIPVLVDNTSMPRPQQLPDSLAPLARRNALELTYNRYDYDLGRLLKAVEKVVGQTAAPTATPSSPEPYVGPDTAGTDSTSSAVASTPAQAAGSEQVAQLLGRASASGEQGRYEEALDDLNRALELEPNNVHALWNRGEIYRLLGRYDEALDDLNRALKLEPNNVHALDNRGVTYRMLGRYDEALDDLNRALKLEPNNVFALWNRGEIYRLLGRYKEALRDLNRALKLEPNNVYALGNRGATYRMLGRDEEALDDLNRALELDPSNSVAVAEHKLL
jgi:tetratricopeptide (TPR) repeat protein